MDNTINDDEFQLKDVTDIKVTYIYINDENEVDDIMMDRWSFSSPNILYRSEIIDILKKYIGQRGKNAKTYTISSILQYNVDLPELSMDERENELIYEYINEMDSLYDDYEVPFLNIIKNIQDIVWNPTLPFLNDLNELIVIFYANKNIGKTTKMTKRVYLRSIKSHTKKNR
jgi:hypothetical protein